VKKKTPHFCQKDIVGIKKSTKVQREGMKVQGEFAFNLRQVLPTPYQF